MIKNYKNVLEQLLQEITEYEEKPTKAASARIRKYSLYLSKQGPTLRAFMIELDKAK